MDHKLDETDVIQPDTLLPSQWRDLCSNRSLSPEQFLLYAVLTDAIALATTAPRTFKQHRLRREALEWIELREHPGPGLSLDYVCEVLDIDADALRKRVAAGLPHIPEETHVAMAGRRVRPSASWRSRSA